MLAAREFCFESPLVPCRPNVRTYAEPSFPAGRPVVDAISELTERIFTDFVYDPGFTTVTTPLEEVLRFRRGVCQDFAHLAIGCFRSMGLAAPYVSGYLETAPPGAEERRIGADASHAWPSVFVPGWGWLDVDPTNDKIVGSTYVTTAWGRDYSDVSPLKGIVFGGGDSICSTSRWTSPGPAEARLEHAPTAVAPRRRYREQSLPSWARDRQGAPVAALTGYAPCHAHPDHRLRPGHRRSHGGRALPGRSRGHRHGPGRRSARSPRRRHATPPRRHRRGLRSPDALAQAGELDAIVNNAAISGKGPMEDFPIEQLRDMFETNTFGPLRLVQQVLPQWRSRGSGVIVNVSSVQGRVATPLEGPYSATKHALEAISESMHYELGHFGIRVVIVQPGYIAPGMKPADNVAGSRAYRQLWEQWEGTDEKVAGSERSARARAGGAGHPPGHRGSDHAAAGSGRRRRDHRPGRQGPARRHRLRVGDAPDAGHDLVSGSPGAAAGACRHDQGRARVAGDQVGTLIRLRAAMRR